MNTQMSQRKSEVVNAIIAFLKRGGSGGATVQVHDIIDDNSIHVRLCLRVNDAKDLVPSTAEFLTLEPHSELSYIFRCLDSTVAAMALIKDSIFFDISSSSHGQIFAQRLQIQTPDNSAGSQLTIDFDPIVDGAELRQTIACMLTLYSLTRESPTIYFDQTFNRVFDDHHCDWNEGVCVALLLYQDVEASLTFCFSEEGFPVVLDKWSRSVISLLIDRLKEKGEFGLGFKVQHELSGGCGFHLPSEFVANYKIDHKVDRNEKWNSCVIVCDLMWDSGLRKHECDRDVQIIAQSVLHNICCVANSTELLDNGVLKRRRKLKQVFVPTLAKSITTISQILNSQNLDTDFLSTVCDTLLTEDRCLTWSPKSNDNDDDDDDESDDDESSSDDDESSSRDDGSSRDDLQQPFQSLFSR